MLKPRYIIIIIILVFICITVAGFGFEQVFIERAARTAYLYTATAAECALKNATMSDEFFTSGVTRDGAASKAASINGSSVNTASALEGLLLDEGTNTYTRKNVFLWTYGISSSSDATRDAEDAYEALFSSSEFKNWATAILDLSIRDNRSNASRQVYWVDEVIDYRTGEPIIKSASGSTRIPKLLTMGTKLFVDQLGYSADDIYDAMVSQSSTTVPVVETFYGKSLRSVSASLSDEEKVMNVLGAADYWEYVRTSSITLNSDNWTSGMEDVTYFYTPTSLGLTYLDPNVLDTFFRSNMDLLMRSQYINNTTSYGATLDSSYTSWFGNKDGISYGSDVGWSAYAVNNGSFYYLRGKPQRGAGGVIEYISPDGSTYRKPDIEYMYITLDKTDLAKMSSSEKAAWNTVLQRAISPVTTLDSLVNEHTANNGERYELCVAKVSFYADFVVPFTSEPMRGMAKNFGESSGTFNESDLRSLEVSEDMIEVASGLLLNGKPLTSFSMEDSAMSGSQQMVYTTYYAIAD